MINIFNVPRLFYICRISYFCPYSITAVAVIYVGENFTFDYIPEQLPVMLALIHVTIGYVAYWFLAAPLASRAGRAVDGFWYRKLTGFITMGILPAVVAFSIVKTPAGWYGLACPHPVATLQWFVVLAVLVVLVTYVNAQKSAVYQEYPEIRVAKWDGKLMVANALGWGVYLLAYEFLFRGFLLFSIADLWGAVPGVAVSTALYTFAHLPKGPAETLGAMVFGVVLGVITLITGSIWTAFLVHWFMSQANDLFAIRAHPEMHWRS